MSALLCLICKMSALLCLACGEISTWKSHLRGCLAMVLVACDIAPMITSVICQTSPLIAIHVRIRTSVRGNTIKAETVCPSACP